MHCNQLHRTTRNGCQMRVGARQSIRKIMQPVRWHGVQWWGAAARPLRDPARGLTAVRSSDACQPPTAVPSLRACPERRRLPSSARLAAVKMRESGRRQAKRRLVSFPQRQSSFQSPTDCASHSQAPRPPSRANGWPMGRLEVGQIFTDSQRSPTPQPRTRSLSDGDSGPHNNSIG